MRCPNCQDTHVVRNTPTSDKCVNCGFVTELATATLHTDTPPLTVFDPSNGYILYLGSRCSGDAEVSLDMTCEDFTTHYDMPAVAEGEEPFLMIERGKARVFISVATARGVALALRSRDLHSIREAENLREDAR